MSRRISLAVASIALLFAPSAHAAKAKAKPVVEKASASVAAPAGPTKVFTAKLFDSKDRSKLMFEQTNEYIDEGNRRTYTSTFRDTAGEIAVIERTVTERIDGKEKLISYQQEQKQLGAIGKIDLVGDKVNFTYTKDGKTKEGSEPFGPAFVVGPTLVPHMRGQWDRIVAGERVKVRLGVVDRLDTVGFSLTKDSEREVAGQKIIVVKLRATSAIIAMAVDPLYFAMKADGSELVELDGRSVVKEKKGDSFKDFSAHVVYTYVR